MEACVRCTDVQCKILTITNIKSLDIICFVINAGLKCHCSVCHFEFEKVVYKLHLQPLLIMEFKTRNGLTNSELQILCLAIYKNVYNVDMYNYM